MGDLTAAWRRLVELVERGEGYDRLERDDRVVYDWGEGRLRHTLYRPLPEDEARAFEEEVAELPPALRELLTEHADGLELLDGDVIIRGVRETDEPDRDISFIEDAAGRTTAFFGTLGSDEEPLYLEPDGRVVLSTHEAATWPSLGEFLVAVVEEGLERCWDEEGRRIADLEVGEPAPELDDAVTLRVPSEVGDRLGALRAVLGDVTGRTVTAGDATYELVSVDALGQEQIGYRVDPKGDDLTGEDDGDWRPTWVVIGTDEDLGDPLFVDLATSDLVVLTAMHGAGSWDPDEVAGSLRELLGG